MKHILTILIFVLASLSAYAQNQRKLINEGNSKYQSKEYNQAIENYTKAYEKDSSLVADYNIANALYKQENYEEAIKKLENISQQTEDKQIKAKAYHNLGNSYLSQYIEQEKAIQSNPQAQPPTSETLKKSIEAYKNALRNNPTDKDTKYNLSYANKKLQEQEQEQQQQNQDQQQDKDQQQQNQDQQQQNQDQQQDKKDKQDQQQQQPQPQKGQISKEDAERMLKAIQDNEKDTQEKVKKQEQQAPKIKTEKQW